MKVRTQHLAWYFGVAFWGVLPLAHSTKMLDDARYPQLIALCLGLTPLVLWFFVGKKIEGAVQVTPAVSRIWWLAIPFAGLTLLSAMWSINAAEAWFVFVHLGVCLAFLQVARHSLAAIPNLLLIVCKVAVGSMSLLAALGILQHLGIDLLGTMGIAKQPVGTMANPNFFADALLFGLPMLCYGLLRFPSRVWKASAGAAIALGITGMLLSQGRSSLLPLTLAAIVFPAVVIWRRLHGRVRSLAMAAFLVVMGLATISVGYVTKQKEGTFNFHLLWEHGHLIGPKTNSLDFRFITWHQTTHVFREHPILGCGAGNWKMEIQRFGVKGFDENGGYGLHVPIQPHNELLGILAELGILGLGLVIGIAFLGIRGAWKMAFDRSGSADSTLGACLLFAWLAILIDSSFSFPMERPFQAMVVYWVLALSLTSGAKSQAKELGLVTKLGWGAALAVILACGITLAYRVKADLALDVLLTQRAAHQPLKVLKTAPRAENWSIQIDPNTALPIEWYVGMAHQELQNIPAALAAFERARQQAPFQLAVRSGYASLLDMSGKSVQGIAELSDLLTVFPDYDEGWYNLVIMQIHAGQLQQARSNYPKLRQDYSPEKYRLIDETLKTAGF